MPPLIYPAPLQHTEELRRSRVHRSDALPLCGRRNPHQGRGVCPTAFEIAQELLKRDPLELRVPHSSHVPQEPWGSTAYTVHRAWGRASQRTAPTEQTGLWQMGHPLHSHGVSTARALRQAVPP